MSALRDAFAKAGISRPQPKAVHVAAPACPYCGGDAEMVTGEVLYPHRPDLHAKRFWRCAPCDAYVGCHAPGQGYGDGTRPLGRLANAELRAAKLATHAAFDPLWRDGHLSRKDAYSWLAAGLGIRVDKCHVGLFTVAECQRAAGLCAAKYRRLTEAALFAKSE